MLFFIIFHYFLLNSLSVSARSPPCSLFNRKLNQYLTPAQLDSSKQSKIANRTFCHGLINNHLCCPSKYEENIQNATAIELHQLFQIHSRRLSEPLVRLTSEFNESIFRLIEASRQETHEVFQRDHPMIYQSFRSWIDEFFHGLTLLPWKTYQYEVKTRIEDLFRHMLRLTYQSETSPRSLTCLWQYHPFSDRPSIIGEEFEFYLTKLIGIHELLQLNRELIQTISTSVKSDFHCLDLYIQLSYCNLCADRQELPCLSNCIDVIESCLVNVTLLDNVWHEFLDLFQNLTQFHGIEKYFFSFGLSLSDSLMTFLKSDKFQQRHIVDRCGQIYRRDELGTNDRPFLMKYTHSLSFVDRQLSSMKESLELYRSFWLILPNQICQSQGVSAPIDSTCWTGTSISIDGRQRIQSNYDKPLSLRVQWLMKEIRDKSKSFQPTTVKTKSSNENRFHLIHPPSLMEISKFNFTDSPDDYPNDEESDYSDYAYEDVSDDQNAVSSTRKNGIASTPLNFHPSSSLSATDDASIDDVHTVAYYDYAEPDAYSDEEIDQESTTTTTTTTTTITTIEIIYSTSSVHIPSYHRRKPIVWNVNIEDDRRNSAVSLTHSFFIIFLFNSGIKLID